GPRHPVQRRLRRPRGPGLLRDHAGRRPDRPSLPAGSRRLADGDDRGCRRLERHGDHHGLPPLLPHRHDPEDDHPVPVRPRDRGPRPGRGRGPDRAGQRGSAGRDDARRRRLHLVRQLRRRPDHPLRGRWDANGPRGLPRPEDDEHRVRRGRAHHGLRHQRGRARTPRDGAAGRITVPLHARRPRQAPVPLPDPHPRL
ncbi:MAG: hypothetical protein AVDCRST_MAG33-2589, partial [uncultured Thermomicrobiales bacterium]